MASAVMVGGGRLADRREEVYQGCCFLWRVDLGVEVGFWMRLEWLMGELGGERMVSAGELGTYRRAWLL